VDRDTLAVKPIADELLKAAAGSLVGEIEQGELSWSNELVLHVVELKTNGPAPALEPLPRLFGEHVRRIDALLEPLGARLMPTGMHPWLDPGRETRLWPHEYNVVYEAFDRIFGCRGHGWSNLQSVHLNLPFCGDEEFGRLYAAALLQRCSFREALRFDSATKLVEVSMKIRGAAHNPAAISTTRYTRSVLGLIRSILAAA